MRDYLALARRGEIRPAQGRWLEELWVPHRSELLRIEVAQVSRIDAERDYVRLHVGDRTYLLLQTIAGLEGRLDPSRFIRIHRSTRKRRLHNNSNTKKQKQMNAYQHMHKNNC